MIVRELLARIGIDLDEKSVSRADAAIAGLKKGLVALGGAYGLKKAYDFIQDRFEQIAHTADDLNRLSQKTGVAVGQLQELQYAAKMADVEAGELQMGLVHLARSAQEAATTGGAAGAEFMRLGLTVTGANGKLKPTAQLLAELADKFSKMPDGPEKAAAAVSLLSRSGANMIPFLNQGSAGFAKMGLEAHRAGVVMSDSLIRRGVELDDGLKRLHASLQGLTYAVLGPFVGAMAKGKNSFAGWINAHRQWIALKVHEVFTTLGNALRFAGEMAQRFSGIFAGVAVALGFIFAPVTTTIALLALLADDIYGYFQGKKSITGIIVNGFKLIGAELSAVWGKFTANPFGFLYDAAKSFFDWFVDQAAKLPGRIAEAMKAFTAPGAGGATSAAQKIGNLNPFVRMGVFKSDWVADLLTWAFQPHAPAAAGALLPTMQPNASGVAGAASGATFAPQIQITAPGDAQGIADKVREALQDFWDTNMRAATPAGQ